MLTYNRKAYMACNFNCFFFENKGLFKVTRTTYYKRGSILETVQDTRCYYRDNWTSNRKWYIAPPIK